MAVKEIEDLVSLTCCFRTWKCRNWRYPVSKLYKTVNKTVKQINRALAGLHTAL